jgi:hypothetical protein
MQSSFNLPFIEIVTNISPVVLGQFVGEHKYKAVMIKRYTKMCTNAKIKIVHRRGEEKGRNTELPMPGTNLFLII